MLMFICNTWNIFALLTLFYFNILISIVNIINYSDFELIFGNLVQIVQVYAC